MHCKHINSGKAQQEKREKGDRGNIIVKEGSSKVFLYSHWTGSDLPEVLKKALKRGESRWNDGQYLARIIFQDMVGDDTGTTGYGISSTIGDGGTDILVDCDNQQVCEPDGSGGIGFKEYVSS